MEKLKNIDSVGDFLRFWRKNRRISQMDLALDTGISSKHLSFVETGRSRPSRKIVLKLAHTLGLSLRHTNVFLSLAGYSPEYTEEPFAGEKMGLVRQALKRMLESHEPYPALVVDTGYKILMANTGFFKFAQIFLDEAVLGKYDNAMRIFFAEDGLRPFVKDWPLIEHFLLTRLLEEMAASQNETLIALYHDLLQNRTADPPEGVTLDTSLPILSFTLEKEGLSASFFSTIATLGTPLDLTTQELRIELLFPADDRTRELDIFKLNNKD